MAKINYQIGEANFSIVMKRIAAILLLEFAEQINQGNAYLPTEIYFDTDFAADEGNIPFVAVNWLEFENESDARAISTNKNKYFIDVKAVGYETTKKIIAAIRTILKSEQYVKLDFDYGIVSDTNVIAAGISFEEKLRGSQGTISGGLTFECLVTENNDKTVSIPLVDSVYESAINESDKKITLIQNY